MMKTYSLIKFHWKISIYSFSIASKCHLFIDGEVCNLAWIGTFQSLDTAAHPGFMHFPLFTTIKLNFWVSSPTFLQPSKQGNFIIKNEQKPFLFCLRMSQEPFLTMKVKNMIFKPYQITSKQGHFIIKNEQKLHCFILETLKCHS